MLDLLGMFKLVFKGFFDLVLDNLLQTFVDLTATVDLQTAVSLRNVMPEED